VKQRSQARVEKEEEERAKPMAGEEKSKIR